MTIRLTDTADRKEYEAARERYEERVKELSEDPSRRWPEDLRPPKPPEPFVDSRDTGLSTSRDERPVSVFGGWGSDPGLLTDLLDKDGTAQSSLPGYEVQNPGAPFTLRRG